MKGVSGLKAATRENLFGKYYLYKLGRLKGFAIAFLALNILSLVGWGAFAYARFASDLADVRIGIMHGINSSDKGDLVAYGALACFIAGMLLMIVMAVVNFKSFTDRPSVDLLCALPITYKERFAGDFLSGLTVSMVSFVPCAVISVILMTAAQNGPLKELTRALKDTGQLLFYGSLRDYYYPDVQDKIALFAFKIILSVLLCYIAAYCIGTFAAVCCGKVSSSVLTALGLIAALPTLFLFTESIIMYNSEGLPDDAPYSMFLIPPISFLASAADRINFDFRFFDGFFVITAPFYLIVNLLVIAAVIIGAYFLGKRRKVEKTGHAFVYTAFYHAVTISAIAVTAEAAFAYYYVERDDGRGGSMGPFDIIFSLIVAFAVYMFIEFLRLRNLKALPKSAVRFIVAALVCVLFNVGTEATESFHLGYSIPNSAFVKSVEVYGEYFYSGRDYNDNAINYTYRNRDSVKTIIKEHRNLVNASPKGGYDQWITYYMRDGRVITRRYAEKDDAVKQFSENVKLLPMENPELFGIVNEPDTQWLSAEYNAEANSTYSKSYAVKPEKIGELAELLRYDIENRHYKEFGTYKYVEFRFMKDGNEESGGYDIYDSYFNTNAFLENPDNFVNMTEESVGDCFTVNYSDTGPQSSVREITATFYKNNTSSSVKELERYIRLSDGSFEESAAFKITSSDKKHYAVSVEDAERAYYALIRLLDQQTTEYFEQNGGNNE